MFTSSNLFLAILSITSFIILVQDFKDRFVSLWVIIVFGLLAISSVIYFRDAVTLGYNLISTFLYFGFIWLILKLYLYLKFSKNKKILNEQIGSADIFIFFFIGITFNTIGLIYFFSLAFVFSLIFFFLYTLIKKSNNEETIPLAGLLVFFYLSAILFLNLSENNFLIDCSFVN